MATEFSRLYRELCHSGPNDPIYDIQFTKERKQVLRALGHDIKSQSKNLKIPKYHGKAARRRAHEARLQAISAEADIERRKEMEIRALSKRTNEVNELTNQIQSLMAQNKFVSKNLWAKYHRIYGEHAEVSEPTKIPPLHPPVAPTIPRPAARTRSTYSENKWTKAEREKLNSIYWTLQKPGGHSMSAWNNYFVDFATQFRIFYNKRSEKEVIAKIKDLYATRQFEEVGESKYWSGLHPDGTDSVKVARGGGGRGGKKDRTGEGEGRGGDMTCQQMGVSPVGLVNRIRTRVGSQEG